MSEEGLHGSLYKGHSIGKGGLLQPREEIFYFSSFIFQAYVENRKIGEEYSVS